MCKQLQPQQLGNTLSTATYAHTGGTMEGICSTEISVKMLFGCALKLDMAAAQETHETCHGNDTGAVECLN